MGDVTCETCGVETWSERHPCVNCETAPPVRDWSVPFQFNEALRGMRLGKRVRRHGWMAYVGIEDRGNGVPLMVIRGPCFPEVLTAYHPCSDDVLANDWEVA